MSKYYEVIADGIGVVGVTSVPADCDECGHEFGAITKRDFERYGDKDWTKPKSKVRYVLKPQPPKLVRCN